MFDYLEVDRLRFKTPRLMLVSPTERNVELFYNNIEDIHDFFRGFSETYESKESFINMFRMWSLITSGEEHFIIKEAETGKYIGHIWRFEHNEIGYALCEKARGKGYCTEAVVALIEYLLYDLKCEFVRAKAYSWNEASINVMKRCGMVPLSTKVTNTIEELHCKVMTFILFNEQYKQSKLCHEC